MVRIASAYVRPREEYRAGHAPDAVSMPIDDLAGARHG
jgi:rhodanese-related sulfurtransferase